MTDGIQIALAASRFNHFIVEQLVDGAQDALARQNLPESSRPLFWVPGAYELPLLADRLARTGRFDAVIALGAVIRGGTPHFDFVAGECSAGLGRVALDRDLPVIMGVLTTDTVEQALERAGTGEGNKGFDAAVTALETLETLRVIGDRYPANPAP
ncbi:6,7-dimethyl-8-ribityllumazine synthase [Elongatibacter sediminis]|uniref:6,7-dimethyl-8-ribityllumazine synthase n=1 Tax=Elongatibacter sediminis TaxID=3119006 RepID=A0AAW9R8B8_9GAMM